MKDPIAESRMRPTEHVRQASRRIYLDHAATTPAHPEVVQAMLPYFTEIGGNPQSLHDEGRRARAALDDARAQVAGVMSADPAEIVFTASGSEGANLAIKGVAFTAARHGRMHLVTSAVEHHAVLHTMQHLARHHGFELTVVPVDAFGRVSVDDVVAAVRPDTAITSVMYANNEVGTIEPIAAIGAALRDHPCAFHTDAVQAAGALSLDVQALNVDLLSIAAHKVYGPKGVGALYVRRGIRLVPQTLGGSQERDRRAGTENVALVVGLAAALVRANATRDATNARLRELTKTLIDGVLRIPNSRLNGHPTDRLPNNANFCLEGVEGESLLLELDAAGIAASSGSACTSASVEPSHVLLAMGIPPHIARSSLRLTTGASNTEEDMRRVVEVLAGVVTRLRAMSGMETGARVG